MTTATDQNYELNANDFQAIADALDYHIQKLSVVFNVAAAVKGISDPEVETAAKKLNTARDLRERFECGHTAWIES